MENDASRWEKKMKKGTAYTVIFEKANAGNRVISGANGTPSRLSRDLGPHAAIGTRAAHGINATEQPRPAREFSKHK